MKKRVDIFNMSFLDIMTILLIISLMLLFSTTVLSSLLPNKEEVLSETKKNTDETESLTRDLDSINRILDSLKSIRFNTRRELNLIIGIPDTTITDSIIDSYVGRYFKTKNNILNTLEAEEKDLDQSIEILKQTIASQRSQFIDRYYRSSRDFIRTQTDINDQLTKIPMFYAVSFRGIRDFETGDFIEVNDIFNRHADIRLASYPFFIVETSGYRGWKSYIYLIDEESVASSVVYGYEPYSSDFNSVYDFFEIPKP